MSSLIDTDTGFGLLEICWRLHDRILENRHWFLETVKFSRYQRHLARYRPLVSVHHHPEIQLLKPIIPPPLSNITPPVGGISIF
jgi:hypothetical protein